MNVIKRAMKIAPNGFVFVMSEQLSAIHLASSADLEIKGRRVHAVCGIRPGGSVKTDQRVGWKFSKAAIPDRLRVCAKCVRLVLKIKAIEAQRRG